MTLELSATSRSIKLHFDQSIMSVDVQHPSPAPAIVPTGSPSPASTAVASSPSPAVPAPSSSYPLRDRSTLVRPERDLPDTSSSSSSATDGSGGGGGGRKEKFLDQFLSSIAPFPALLHAKLTKMRELDDTAVLRMREMDEWSKQHVHNIRRKWKQDNTTADPSSATTATSASLPASSSSFSSASPGDASSVAPSTAEQPPVSATPNAMSLQFGVGAAYDIEAAELHLRSQRDELLRISRAKQSLASECYEGVDGHIRRLDVSLRKYETKLRKGTFEVTAQPVDRRKGAETQWDAEGRTMAAEVAAELKSELDRQEGTGGGRRVKARSEAGGAGGEGGKEGGGGLGEPTYCLCHKVSFGQMVACDNDDCEIEWFHFACVGLESKPRGKWLCPQCREGKKKKTKTK